MTRQEHITKLLGDPELLLLKKPFLRGSGSFATNDNSDGSETNVTSLRRAVLPRIYKTVVSQNRFALELDPNSHDVLFDKNLPSVCVKLDDGSYEEIKFQRYAIPFQKLIRDKKTLSLCGNPVQFTLRGKDPSEKDNDNFSTFKEYWTDRNQDGMITKAVHTQLSYGDVGLLFYHNAKGEIKSRILTYEDGYVIISHNDDNGDRLMECVYYADAKGIEHADCYTDRILYRMTSEDDWSVKEAVPHGFSEIPIATKRGDVAWNDVQSLIESFETLYNIFFVIQKRHGWGILYIKGKINETTRKLAGSIILNDTSVDGNGSAEFKQPPSPQGMIDTLENIKEQIQIGAKCTFILPKDVKTGGDISALAIMLTQELDIEGATSNKIEWQNFIDKCKRLFAEGLAKELVANGENKNAITEFERLRIGATFKIWRPFSESEYNQMLATLKGAGILSKKTAIEKNTVSQPDEERRIAAEEAIAEERARREQEATAQMNARMAAADTQQND